MSQDLPKKYILLNILITMISLFVIYKKEYFMALCFNFIFYFLLTSVLSLSSTLYKKTAPEEIN